MRRVFWGLLDFASDSIVLELDTTKLEILRHSTNPHAYVVGYGHHLLELGEVHGLIIYNGISRWPSSGGLTCFPQVGESSTIDYFMDPLSLVS